MLQSQTFSSPSPLLYLILLSLISFATSKPNGFTLELIHSDSPESPFYLGKLTDTQRINKLVESSKIRAHYLNSNLKRNSTFDPEAYRFLVDNDNAMYTVKVQIGTPRILLYLLLDTGSDLTWTQCEPCTYRYHQLPPIYNSSASRSYRKISCQDPFCIGNREAFQCINEECVYRVGYGSGDITRGVASTEELESTDNQRISFNFGCSKDNRNFSAFARTGKTGGIMGLNMSPVSILQQLRNITRQRFSYCLVPSGSAPPHNTLLRFGKDIRTWGRGFLSTPFVNMPGTHMSHYYLNLTDLSVDRHRLRLPPDTFALKHDGTGGAIIDSGTTITLVVQPAYRLLLSAFQNHFDHHGFHRAHPPGTRYELCYNFGQHRTYSNHASLTYHLQGADFTVEPKYVYAVYSEHNAFCVAFIESRIQGLTIIGALHQANTRFIYNAEKRKLKFKAENCQRDTR